MKPATNYQCLFHITLNPVGYTNPITRGRFDKKNGNATSQLKLKIATCFCRTTWNNKTWLFYNYETHLILL